MGVPLVMTLCVTSNALAAGAAPAAVAAAARAAAWRLVMDQRGPWAGEGSMQVINASAEGWMREGALGPWRSCSIFHPITIAPDTESFHLITPRIPVYNPIINLIIM